MYRVEIADPGFERIAEVVEAIVGGCSSIEDPNFRRHAQGH
jgi:hypothetical protein